MNTQPSPTPEALAPDPIPVGGEGVGELPALQPEVCARARAFEAHLAAFRRELFSLPGAARELLARWAALRREGRPSGCLAVRCGDDSGRDWNLHVDSHLSRLERRVAEHEPLIGNRSDGGRRRRTELEDEIERLLSGTGVALAEAIEIFETLRALAAAPRSRETLELRRRAGLTSPTGRLRLRRAARALERLDGFRRSIATDHLDLVHRLARIYRDRGVPYLDLMELGNVALLHAVESFDYRSGVDFSEHAAAWVERTLAEAVRDAPRAA